MNIIKILLAILGLFFGVVVVLWLFNIISSLLWYGVWIGLLAAVGYGGYRLFRKAEDKFVGSGSRAGYIDEVDQQMSWEEYDRKYLNR